MRLLLVAATLVLLTAVASAQGNIGNSKNPDIVKEYEQRKKDAIDVDKEYKSTIKAIPEQKRTTDPWAGVREAEPAKLQKKPK